MTNQIGREFLLQSQKLLLEDYLPIIEFSARRLGVEQTWWRANEHSNSVGNLLLHLSGNVRQWIISGIGGDCQDARKRELEFNAREHLPSEELLTQLRATVEEAARVLENFDSEKLLEKRIIQGREVSALDAVYHVVEHFAMHAGQIIFVAKMFSGNLDFYEDAGGLARPKWKTSPAADE